MARSTGSHNPPPPRPYLPPNLAHRYRYPYPYPYPYPHSYTPPYPYPYPYPRVGMCLSGGGGPTRDQSVEAPQGEV